jgi:type I restriction-modification system DNA methylase subunit
MLHEKFGRGKGITTNNKPNDDILTPLEISKKIIDMFDIQGTVLDPFKGQGSFYNQFPEYLYIKC